jgi:hypothetical protein
VNERERYAGFEPVGEDRPGWLHAPSPDGPLAALHYRHELVDAVAVWDLTSGRVVWAPPATSAMNWSADGRMVALVRFIYEPEPRDTTREYAYHCERRRWPERDVLDACPIKFPTGWPTSVTISPRGDLIAIAWVEQDCAGLIFVEVRADGDRQSADLSLRTELNRATPPAFSPDGRYIARSCGRYDWWYDGDDHDAPSLGGPREIGHVSVLDLDGGSTIEHTFVVQVERGWRPEDPDDFDLELLGIPSFESEREFTVNLPIYGSRRVKIDGDMLVESID